MRTNARRTLVPVAVSSIGGPAGTITGRLRPLRPWCPRAFLDRSCLPPCTRPPVPNGDERWTSSPVGRPPPSTEPCTRHRESRVKARFQQHAFRRQAATPHWRWLATRLSPTIPQPCLACLAPALLRIESGKWTSARRRVRERGDRSLASLR